MFILAGENKIDSTHPENITHHGNYERKRETNYSKWKQVHYDFNKGEHKH